MIKRRYLPNDYDEWRPVQLNCMEGDGDGDGTGGPGDTSSSNDGYTGSNDGYTDAGTGDYFGDNTSNADFFGPSDSTSGDFFGDNTSNADFFGPATSGDFFGDNVSNADFFGPATSGDFFGDNVSNADFFGPTTSGDFFGDNVSNADFFGPATSGDFFGDNVSNADFFGPTTSGDFFGDNVSNADFFGPTSFSDPFGDFQGTNLSHADPFGDFQGTNLANPYEAGWVGSIDLGVPQEGGYLTGPSQAGPNAGPGMTGGPDYVGTAETGFPGGRGEDRGVDLAAKGVDLAGKGLDIQSLMSFVNPLAPDPNEVLGKSDPFSMSPMDLDAFQSHAPTAPPAPAPATPDPGPRSDVDIPGTPGAAPGTVGIGVGVPGSLNTDFSSVSRGTVDPDSLNRGTEVFTTPPTPQALIDETFNALDKASTPLDFPGPPPSIDRGPLPDLSPAPSTQPQSLYESLVGPAQAAPSLNPNSPFTNALEEAQTSQQARDAFNPNLNSPIFDNPINYGPNPNMQDPIFDNPIVNQQQYGPNPGPNPNFDIAFNPDTYTSQPNVDRGPANPNFEFAFDPSTYSVSRDSPNPNFEFAFAPSIYAPTQEASRDTLTQQDRDIQSPNYNPNPNFEHAFNPNIYSPTPSRDPSPLVEPGRIDPPGVFDPFTMQADPGRGRTIDDTRTAPEVPPTETARESKSDLGKDPQTAYPGVQQPGWQTPNSLPAWSTIFGDPNIGRDAPTGWPEQASAPRADDPSVPHGGAQQGPSPSANPGWFTGEIGDKGFELGAPQGFPNAPQTLENPYPLVEPGRLAEDPNLLDPNPYDPNSPLTTTTPETTPTSPDQPTTTPSTPNQTQTSTPDITPSTANPQTLDDALNAALAAPSGMNPAGLNTMGGSPLNDIFKVADVLGKALGVPAPEAADAVLAVVQETGLPPKQAAQVVAAAKELAEKTGMTMAQALKVTIDQVNQEQSRRNAA